MAFGLKFLNNLAGNLAAGAVSSLMEADNKAAAARKAEAEAKMKAYELQKKQMEEDARRRKKAEEIATIKAQADADKLILEARAAADDDGKRIRDKAREQAEAVFETKTILQLPNHPEEMALLTGEMSQGEYREKASQLKDEILGMIRIKD